MFEGLLNHLDACFHKRNRDWITNEILFVVPNGAQEICFTLPEHDLVGVRSDRIVRGNDLAAAVDVEGAKPVLPDHGIAGQVPQYVRMAIMKGLRKKFRRSGKYQS